MQKEIETTSLRNLMMRCQFQKIADWVDGTISSRVRTESYDHGDHLLLYARSALTHSDSVGDDRMPMMMSMMIR